VSRHGGVLSDHIGQVIVAVLAVALLSFMKRPHLLLDRRFSIDDEDPSPDVIGGIHGEACHHHWLARFVPERTS